MLQLSLTATRTGSLSPKSEISLRMGGPDGQRSLEPLDLGQILVCAGLGVSGGHVGGWEFNKWIYFKDLGGPLGYNYP